jgi:ethanolamine ammonia-lyase small subunit
MTDPEVPGAQALARLRARTRAVTAARVFTGGPDGGYGTRDLLALRADHAAARDAVHARLDVTAGPLAALVREHRLLPVATEATTAREHLLRPDRGRRLDAGSRALIAELCPAAPDLQVVLGDGLSATAVARHGPALLAALLEGAARRGWRAGRPLAVRHCRVGVLNDVGELLAPVVVVLLIGERPGLGGGDSLSAYMAHRPRAGHTDAHRNLVSNIRTGGTPVADAASRVLALADAMRAAGRSGVGLGQATPSPPSIDMTCPVVHEDQSEAR